MVSCKSTIRQITRHFVIVPLTTSGIAENELERNVRYRNLVNRENVKGRVARRLFPKPILNQGMRAKQLSETKMNTPVYMAFARHIFLPTKLSQLLCAGLTYIS